MTVSTAPSRNDYSGNGILTTFAYTFRIFADADLSVLVAGVPKTLTTDYTVTGAGATGGGNVVFVSAPTGAVAIVRNVSAKQDVDLVENDPFSAETVEAALDRAEMLIQQLQEIIGRSLAVATSSTQKNLVVDDLVAGKFLQVKTPASAGLQMVDVTASGSIGIPVSIAQGGTGQTTADAALSALGGIPTIYQKFGSGAGTYTTPADTNYHDVDATNLAFTNLAIPAGSKFLIFVCGAVFSTTAAELVYVDLDDSGTALIENITKPTGVGVQTAFCLCYALAGNGGTHTIKLRFKTGNGTNVANIQNSGNAVPSMVGILLKAN